MDNKKSIYEKLAEIQNDLKVGKGQYNNFGGYSYRSAEDILSAVKPIAQKHGAVVICQDQMEVINGHVYLCATATLHSTDSGEEVSTKAYAREAEAKKGASPEQLSGMASSYARKYCLQGLFSLSDPKLDPDTEANSRAEAETQKQADRREVDRVIAKISAIESATPVDDRINKTAAKYGVTSLYALTNGQLADLKAKLRMD